MDLQEERNEEADAIEENRQKLKIIEINSESTEFAKCSAIERQELAEK